jgi:MFS transporter, DHA2 family, multidrug resistance protein
VIFSLGLAPVYVLTTQLTLSGAPSERAGTASGILETAAALGGALGITVLGKLAATVYRGAVDRGTPETLGQALAAAARLPGPAADRVADAARDAFTLGFQSAELVGALPLFALTVASALALPRTT